jgi:hypothetical protein
LAETLRQRGNREVTNKQFGIEFGFLVMTNTWAICHGETPITKRYTQGVLFYAKVEIARSNVSRAEGASSLKDRYEAVFLFASVRGRRTINGPHHRVLVDAAE